MWRERIEQDIDRWLKPFEDALQAEQYVLARNGDVVAKVPDHPVRMAASREGFDRSYGRPRQTTEISGGLTIMDIALGDE